MRVLPLLLLTLLGCKSEAERTIEGNWFASELTECGNPLEVDGNIVQFEFKPNNEYAFHGTLNVHEAGKFYIRQNYLYTHHHQLEKAVRIDKLTVDSLVLGMEHKGKERLLTLLRSEPEISMHEHSKESDTVTIPMEDKK